MEKTAERFRKSPSYLEKIMIEILDEIGVKYQFQVPWRKRYILDFWIPGAHLNIECDGVKFHQHRKIKDSRRDWFLWKKSKLRVIRFPSYDFKNKQKIIERILSKLKPQRQEIPNPVEEYYLNASNELDKEFKKVVE